MADLSKELETILNKFSKTAFEATQTALKESAQETAQLLAASSPSGGSSPSFSSGFDVAIYKNVVYIGNTKTTANNVPLINIINKQTGLVESVWNRNKSNIESKTIQRIMSKIK